MNKRFYFEFFLRNNFMKFVLLLCILFSFITCNTIKAIRQKPVDEKSISQLIQLLSENEFKPEWFSAKTNATINFDGKENSVAVSLRMRRDSVLWLSFSAIGIEMARIMITQDSIKVLDRINSKYLISDYKYFEKIFSTEISYEDIQAIILGNSFRLKDEKKYRSAYIDSSYYILSTLGKRKLKRNILEDRDPNKKFVQDLWIEPNTYKLAKLNIDDQRSNVKILCQYENFKPIEDSTLFPFMNTIEIKAKKNVHVLLEYSKVNINKLLEFPFAISDKYEKMN